MIHDGRSLTGLSLDEWSRSAVTQRIARREGWKIPPLSAVDTGAEPAIAIVNWGSWKAECPDTECPGGAADVWVEGPSLLFCPACGNRVIGGLWRPVAMPADVAAVEQFLEPLRRHFQNWRPEAGG